VAGGERVTGAGALEQMYPFSYHRAATLADAVAVLQGDDGAKLLAGGQSLLPAMRQRLAMHATLVDIGALAELTGIRREGDRLVIGAAEKHADVAYSTAVRAAIPALAELAGGIGDPLVRHAGTLGGSLANNDPAADYPAAALALDARIRTTERELAASEFFSGMFETALRPAEIVTAVSFHIPRRAAYAKFPNPASRYAMAGAFVAELDDGPRVAITGAAPCVFRAPAFEAALAREFRPEAIAELTFDAADMLADMHGSAAYRAHLAGVVVRRAIEACVD
jgi:carbon-monoxide dehydrogenase medium subunit